ncbi:MAG: alpha/beta fold hydrolase [Syntrophobacterales bacterium]|nr:alpha/beta fold hydrolase [Syntrophobacterales bacterium]
MGSFFLNGTIPVVIHEPHGTPKATVVFLHGLMGYKDSEKFLALSEAVVSEGWRAVRFDQAGSGESKSPLERSLLYSRLRDLVDVAEWVKRELLGEGERLCLWGSSLGGYLSYLYVFSNAFKGDMPLENSPVPIDATISWATSFDVSALADFLRKTPPFCDHLDLLDPVGYPKTLEKIGELTKLIPGDFPPCLIVHGMKDEVVPWSQAVQIQKITKGDLILFDEADHRFSDRGYRELATRATIKWIKRRLFMQLLQ